MYVRGQQNDKLNKYEYIYSNDEGEAHTKKGCTLVYTRLVEYMQCGV